MNLQHTRSEDGQLSEYIRESCEEEEEFHFLAFEAVQRRNIVSLQNEVARMKTKLRKTQNTSEDDEKLAALLHMYVTAIRDYAYSKSHIALPHDEMNRRRLRLKRHFPEVNDPVGRPFDSHYFYVKQHLESTDSVRKVIRRFLPTELTYSADEKKARQLEYETRRPAHGISTTVDGLARFLVAFVGGAFLVVPMIVMVRSAELNTSIITTSAAVLIFAVALSAGIRATNVETMVSTATYAAVLVVFVGAYNTPGSNDSVGAESSN